MRGGKGRFFGNISNKKRGIIGPLFLNVKHMSKKNLTRDKDWHKSAQKLNKGQKSDS